MTAPASLSLGAQFHVSLLHCNKLVWFHRVS
jgi:hypothetical protein